jgi:hypothetical protein
VCRTDPEGSEQLAWRESSTAAATQQIPSAGWLCGGADSDVAGTVTLTADGLGDRQAGLHTLGGWRG